LILLVIMAYIIMVGFMTIGDLINV